MYSWRENLIQQKRDLELLGNEWTCQNILEVRTWKVME